MKMNLFQSITNAMEIALESDPTASKLQGGKTIKKMIYCQNKKKYCHKQENSK